MKKVLCVWLFIVSCLLFLVWGGFRIYKSYDFNIGAGGHLKRAADANTVELATKEMEIAISYIESKNLTSGYTSIFIKTPDEDLGFWYTNLKSSLAELKSVNASASQLEKTNLLIKLRETLLDNGESTSITCPEGISIYPYNLLCFIWGWASYIFAFISFVWMLF